MTEIKVGSKWDINKTTVQVVATDGLTVFFVSVGDLTGCQGQMTVPLFLAAARPAHEKLKIGQIVRHKEYGTASKWHVRAFDERDHAILQRIGHQDTPTANLWLSSRPTTQHFEIIQDVI